MTAMVSLPRAACNLVRREAGSSLTGAAGYGELPAAPITVSAYIATRMLTFTPPFRKDAGTADAESG